MQTNPEPLFAPIQRDELAYCIEVAPIERLLVRIDDTGKLVIKGQRAEIEVLLILLRKQGLIGELRYLSFCG